MSDPAGFRSGWQSGQCGSFDPKGSAPVADGSIDATLAGPMFRILGPLDVSTIAADQPDIPPGRHQTVLAALLLEANRVVRVDQLIDTIWYDDPPVTARAQVQICVSGLRSYLGRLDTTAVIVTRPPGYLLTVPKAQLDAHLFTDLVASSDAFARAGQPAEASAAIRRAIELWRGPSLSGTTSRVLQTKAAQWDEKRLNAIETYAELELSLGRHHQLIDEIRGLVDENPLREHLRGQLMLALYRSGRQADALRTYRDGREVIVDQLGIEPSAELRALEHAILRGDEQLLPSPLAAPAPTAAETATVPRELPLDIVDFTGRTDLITRVGDRLLATGPRETPVIVLTGKPGVGKSSLAIRTAHRLVQTRYPDGQLFADLGGTRTEPVTSADILGRFLRALGVPGPAIPDSVDDRATMYRGLLGHRHMLVVLDDAANEAQVRPLLPGGDSCGVIVTSRTRLTGLAGAAVIEVDVMDEEQSLHLLREIIGEERVAGEPAAASALIRLVGGLPLALRVVAARLAARPHWSLAWMRERLADERRRLDELTHGELMVRASLAMSYDGLDPGARRLLRMLSGLDTSSFPVWVAAAMLDVDQFEASDLLELLVDVQMLEIAALDLNGSPRYKFHDIIRLFAREQWELHDSPESRRADVRRVAGGWLAMAREAHRLIYGGEFTVVRGAEVGWMPPASYADQVLVDPLRWLEAERANLCAAVGQSAAAGLDELSWDLAVALVTLFESRCYYEDWERTHSQALVATRAAGNHRGVAALTCSLASLHLSRGRLDAAEELIVPALTTFDELGDARGRALARRNLALLHQMRGDRQLAVVHYDGALADFAASEDPIGQAHVLSQIAQIELDAGDETAAGAHLNEALAICAGIGSRRVEVQVRYRLSSLLLVQGRYVEASEVLTALLGVVRAGRDVEGEGRILHRLGVATAMLGRTEEAGALLREALTARHQIMDHHGVAEVRADLIRFSLGLDQRAPDVARA
jgi:DNA-binding SARP family transcriptional activator/tetratricopeptide (TPR) repeat protein